MPDKIKLRRGTAALWTERNPVLAAGEPGLETDTRKIKYGDGSTAWNSLAYSYTGAGGGGGSGDVSGPGASTDNALVRWDGTTGELVQSSTATLSDAGLLTTTAVTVTNLTVSGALSLPAGTVTLTMLSSAVQTSLGKADSAVQPGGALGTPASGTLTNCTGLPAAGVGSGTFTLPRVPLLDAGLHFAEQVDRRIAGKTGTSAERLLFTSMTHTGTPAYVRSSSHWAADVDLTGVGVWNSATGTQIGFTAISARHVLICHHSTIADGTTLRWVTAGNVIVERTLSSSARIGSTDLRVGLLSSALPGTITPVRMAPADLSTLCGMTAVPYAVVDQEMKLNIADAQSSITAIAAGGGGRAAFYEAGISGDSGHPWLLLVDGAACMVSLYGTDTTGPDIPGNLSAIQSAMDTAAAGYTLDTVDMPGGPEWTAVRNKPAFSNAALITASATPASGQIPLVDGSGQLPLSVLGNAPGGFSLPECHGEFTLSATESVLIQLVSVPAASTVSTFFTSGEFAAINDVLTIDVDGTAETVVWSGSQWVGGDYVTPTDPAVTAGMVVQLESLAGGTYTINGLGYVSTTPAHGGYALDVPLYPKDTTVAAATRAALGITGGSGIANVVEDTSPQLGGQLDMNGQSILAGAATITPTELGYLDGVTSAIQTQLNNKSDTGHNHSGVYEPVLTAASQAEMEAGTEAAVRKMSPLRVAQAIAALAPDAQEMFDALVTANLAEVAATADTLALRDGTGGLVAAAFTANASSLSSSGVLHLDTGGGFGVNLTPGTLSADRTATFPDKSGTVAMTSDITGARYIKYLTADMAAYTSTTLQNITGLTQAVLAGETWRFEAYVIFKTGGTTKGISIAMNGPTTSFLSYYGKTDISTSAQAPKNNTAWESKIDGTLGPGASNQWEGYIRGIATVTADGTIAVRMACFDAAVSVTVLTSTHAVFEKV